MKAAFLVAWSAIIFGTGIFFMAWAQQAETVIEVGEELSADQISKMREESEERTRKLRAAYRSDAVKSNCMADPTARFPATVDGESFMIDCLFWTRWYEAEQEAAAADAAQ